jgi:hypothetical protein
VKRLYALVFFLFTTVRRTRAGDDASGPIKYSVDLGRPFPTYAMSEKDKAWSRSLAS